MLRKFLPCGGFAALLLLGTAVPAQIAAARSQQAQQQNQQSAANAKSVSGKVVSVGSDRKSFALQTDKGNTMQFVLDNNTQVTGRVGTGSAAVVQYQKNQNGKNLALVVSPAGQGRNQNPQ